MATDGIYYFNRCRRCLTLLTKLQILKGFERGGEMCACGGAMFGPTNPLWYEWLLPRVLKMVVYQLLGKLEPAPAPSETHAPISATGTPVPALAKEEVCEDEDE